jgi:hypothetical protein
LGKRVGGIKISLDMLEKTDHLAVNPVIQPTATLRFLKTVVVYVKNEVSLHFDRM